MSVQAMHKCKKCGRKQLLRYEGSTDDRDAGYFPPMCPKCRGEWETCDSPPSARKTGDLKKCGRCQGTKPYDGTNSVWVTNAPAGIHNSWCGPCVREVNGGAKSILRGSSIDRDGFVIAATGVPPATPREERKTPPKTPEEKLKNVTRCLLFIGWFNVVATGLAFVVYTAIVLSGAQKNDPKAPRPVVIYGVQAVGMLIAAGVVSGAIRLRRREKHSSAMLTAALASVPLGACCMVTFPIGLYCLVTLADKNVKRLFKQGCIRRFWWHGSNGVPVGVPLAGVPHVDQTGHFADVADVPTGSPGL